MGRSAVRKGSIVFERLQVSEEEDVSAKWVLSLRECVAVGVLSDLATLAVFSVLHVLGHEISDVPSDFLSRSLLPRTALARKHLAGADTLRHGLELEGSVNLGRIILNTSRFLLSSKASNHAWVPRVSVVGLLGDHSD